MRRLRLNALFFALALMFTAPRAFAAPVGNPSDSTAAAPALPALPAVATAHAGLYQFYINHGGLYLSDDDNLALYDMVRRWHRTPYRWAGRSLRGTDCQGFAAQIQDTVFCRKLNAGAGAQYAQCTPVRKDELKAGDLVFFKIGTYHISHVGVYLKDGKFAHATVCCGVIVSDLSEPYYRRWYYAGGRLPEHVAPFELNAGPAQAAAALKPAN